MRSSKLPARRLLFPKRNAVLPKNSRNFTMAYNKAIRFVIHDGAGQYTRSFDNVFAAVGADAITTPPGAPKANSFAERWVRTVRHELLDRTLIWNQRQLHRLLTEFVQHYNEHRPHRSLNQQAPNDQHDAEVLEIRRPIRRTSLRTEDGRSMKTRR